MPKKITIATSTRADWGLLSPLAHALHSDPEVELSLLITNMHLLPEFGNTIEDILNEGFTNYRKVPMNIQGDSDDCYARGMADCLVNSNKALHSLQPDILVILGDRFEMLSIATAATMQKIPIAHIAGGEISQGAIDDNIRHAITKLASLHFTETEEYRRRVIQMGEQPDNVINAGALGVWNIMNQPLLTPSELMADLQWNFTPGKLILVTLHPATQGHNEEVACKNMLSTLQDLQDYNILITYPNNDAGHQDIIKQLNDWCPQHPNVKLVKSLGMRRYLSMLRCAAVVVGNSSSGIIEVPSMGIPTVDIGSRQRGRVAANSVIHCGTSKAEIADAIALALSPSMQALASRKENPYYNPNTVSLIKSKLLTPSTSSLLPKTFYDLPSKIQ